MIVAKNLETKQYLDLLRRQEQEDKARRRRDKKLNGMRLARELYHRDGSVTRIWRND